MWPLPSGWEIIGLFVLICCHLPLVFVIRHFVSQKNNSFYLFHSLHSFLNLVFFHYLVSINQTNCLITACRSFMWGFFFQYLTKAQLLEKFVFVYMVIDFGLFL